MIVVTPICKMYSDAAFKSSSAVGIVSAVASEPKIAITDRPVLSSQRGLVVRMLLQWFYPLFSKDARADAGVSRVASPGSAGTIEYDGKAVTAEFRFVDGPSGSLSAIERQAFIADFENAAKNLRAWSLRQRWAVPALPKLGVVIAAAFRISRALVPAWEGRSGIIEFPARRVAAGRAAIVHELTHVFFPNGNRLLAEGLAIYLEALLGRNPAFPNFSQPLHESARHHLLRLLPAFASGDTTALERISIAPLDAIPTPNPLTLEIGGCFCGEDKDGQAAIYSLAGSFVQFLIDTRGLGKFRSLFARTPLRARELDAGSSNRWRDVYGQSLTDLDRAWKSMLAEAPLALPAYG
jgi:hypothetical protein